MLSFKTCEKAPEQGGRGGVFGVGDGGGLVEVEGRVVWGGGGGVYMYEEDRWSGPWMMFRCLMAGHRPGTEDHHFLSHVGACQQWSMGTWSS